MARKRPKKPEERTGLRIVAGALRGARLLTPPGLVARPMRDRVREALFNILGPGAAEGARVLDLFAGSGSLGFEAVSRGASQAVFVERAPPCLDVLARNAAALRVEDRVVVLRHDLAAGLGPAAAHAPFDLVFVHPPFDLFRRPPGPGEADVALLLRTLAAGPGLLAAGAVVAFETPREHLREEGDVTRLGLELVLRREYGSTALFVAKRLAVSR